MPWRSPSRRTGCSPPPDGSVSGKDRQPSAVEVRLSRDDAASITQVVAEGAGQEMMATSETAERDPSGNVILSDVGLWMASQTKKYFKDRELVRLSTSARGSTAHRPRQGVGRFEGFRVSTGRFFGPCQVTSLAIGTDSPNHIGERAPVRTESSLTVLRRISNRHVFESGNSDGELSRQREGCKKTPWC